MVQDRQTIIHVSTYNIRNGMNGELESALQGMAQTNLDLGVFQETNIMNGIHTHASVAFFYRGTPHF